MNYLSMRTWRNNLLSKDIARGSRHDVEQQRTTSTAIQKTDGNQRQTQQKKAFLKEDSAGNRQHAIDIRFTHCNCP